VADFSISPSLNLKGCKTAMAFSTLASADSLIALESANIICNIINFPNYIYLNIAKNSESEQILIKIEVEEMTLENFFL
jgi:hypothetical protein